MKKIVLFSILAIFLNGCRYINTKEPYLEAKPADKLEVPAGLDSPNASSTLEVPAAKGGSSALVSSAPPNMPIRTRQSEDGEIRIENVAGYPLLTVKTDKEFMWEAMNNLDLEGWSVASADKENCILLMNYIDQAAKEREEAGFFKKMFTRDKYYSDHSGEYKLSCEEKGSVTQAKFIKSDGTAAKTFISDNLMTKLYKQFDS